MFAQTVSPERIEAFLDRYERDWQEMQDRHRKAIEWEMDDYEADIADFMSRAKRGLPEERE